MKQIEFGHKKLDVWHRAMDFTIEVIGLTGDIQTDRKHFRLIEQLEASSSSIAANIAEGKGRFSQKEFTRFLYIARGSLYETMTHLEIFRRMNWVIDEDYARIEKLGIELASMIKGLINVLNKD